MDAITRSGGRLSQTALVSVPQDVRIKQIKSLCAYHRLIKGNNLIVHKHREDRSLQEGREEGLADHRLIREVRSLVKVLKLFSVFLPLLKILSRHDDELLVVEEMLHKVIRKCPTDGRGKISVGSVRDVIPVFLLGVVIVITIEVKGAFIN